METITFTHIHIDTLNAGMGPGNRVSGKMKGVNSRNEMVEFSFHHSFGDNYSDSLQLPRRDEEFPNLKYDELVRAIEIVFRRNYDKIVGSISQHNSLKFDESFESVIGTPTDNTFNISTIDE